MTWIAAVPLAAHAASNLNHDTFQAALSALANLEARHDIAGWQKLALTLFSPNAVVTTTNGPSKRRETLPQYCASERKNLAQLASSTGTVEHDYLQVFHAAPGGATAASELTVHSHEITSQGPAAVDFIIARRYKIAQQGSEWRITRLSVETTTVSVNGHMLSFAAPVKRTR